MTVHEGKRTFQKRLEELIAAAGSPKPATICATSKQHSGKNSLSVQRISDWRNARHLPSLPLFKQFLVAVRTLAVRRKIVLPTALASDANWEVLLREARRRNSAPSRDEPTRTTTEPVDFPIYPVADAKPLELGVHRTSRVEDAPPLPVYVSRDVDGAVVAQVVEAGENGGVVLLVGESTAGKSRCAFEAVRLELADRWIIAPRAASELSPVLSHVSTPGSSRKWVLWLDDLDRYLLPGGLDRSMLTALLERGVVVVATMRSAVYGHYSERAARGADAGMASARRLGSQVLNLIEPIVLDRQWSEAEMSRLHAHLASPNPDARLADAALHHDVHGIAEYLAAGPKLLEEFLTTRRRPEGHPRGAALVQTAIDLARAGISTPLPAGTLQTLSRCYLTEGDVSRLRAESPEQALAWATEVQFGVAGMLIATETADAWRPFDYLVDAVAGSGETAADMPDEVWEGAVAHADGGGELLSVGRSAFRSGRPALAERCFSPLAARGDKSAMHHLAFVQRERRPEHTWPSWYQEVATTGNPLQARVLGTLHESEGRRDDAAVCYERAASQGDALAMRLRGAIAERCGQHEEAHRWYVRAAKNGDAVAISHFNQPKIYTLEVSQAPSPEKLDPAEDWESEEEWQMTPRTSRILSCSLEILADMAHDELNELNEQPISPKDFGVFFARLPASTWDQPRSWRRRMLRALDDLNEDITLGHSPKPRCAAEELALHFALESASAMTQDDPELVAHFTEGLPEQQDDYDWFTCSDLLFQDHDVLFLYDPTMQGVEHPSDWLNKTMGIGDLRPESWFREFWALPHRDPTRGFRH